MKDRQLQLGSINPINQMYSNNPMYPNMINPNYSNIINPNYPNIINPINPNNPNNPNIINPNYPINPNNPNNPNIINPNYPNIINPNYPNNPNNPNYPNIINPNNFNNFNNPNYPNIINPNNPNNPNNNFGVKIALEYSLGEQYNNLLSQINQVILNVNNNRFYGDMRGININNITFTDLINIRQNLTRMGNTGLNADASYNVKSTMLDNILNMYTNLLNKLNKQTNKNYEQPHVPIKILLSDALHFNQYSNVPIYK